MLNHWDNLDGTIERGYAGKSLWQWDELSDTVSARYQKYARANASVGINGTVLNNVNASVKILSSEYLEKVRVLADIFRPYGIKVYLSVNFASPMQLGGLSTADPLNEEVAEWWKRRYMRFTVLSLILEVFWSRLIQKDSLVRAITGVRMPKERI